MKWFALILVLLCCAAGYEATISRSTGHIITIKEKPCGWTAKDTNATQVLWVQVTNFSVIAHVQAKLVSIGKTIGPDSKFPYSCPMVTTNSDGRYIEAMVVDVEAAETEMESYGYVQTTNVWHSSTNVLF